jgi:nucleoredoxin
MRSLFIFLTSLLACAQSVAADFDWSTIFKEGLVNAEGKPVAASTLKGKVVAVYFSAEWCGPCRTFSPQLVKFAEKNAAKMAVVFVSFDESNSAMLAYMKKAKMPWAAVPFQAKSAETIAKKYNVSGIPKLLVLGKDGKLLTSEGRNLANLQKLLDK